MSRLKLAIALCSLFGIPAAVFAQQSFQGPAGDPPTNNPPGLIWNHGTVAEPQIKVGGASVVHDLFGDVKLTTGKSFKIDDMTSSDFTIGNFAGGSQKPFTLSIPGGIYVSDIDADQSLGHDGRVQAKWFCFSQGDPTDCISTWDFVDKTGDGMTGALSIAPTSPTATALTIPNGGASISSSVIGVTANGGLIGGSFTGLNTGLTGSGIVGLQGSSAGTYPLAKGLQGTATNGTGVYGTGLVASEFIGSTTGSRIVSTSAFGRALHVDATNSDIYIGDAVQGNGIRVFGMSGVGHVGVNSEVTSNAVAGEFSHLTSGNGVLLGISSVAMQTNGRVNFYSTTNTLKFYFDPISNIAAKIGGGSWSALSDRRLKDVHGSYTRGLEAVNQIRPVNFSYKNDPSKNYIGVVAQDIEQVIPEAVSKNEEGYLMVNNDPVIWALVNSVKELKAENAALKQRVEALER